MRPSASINASVPLRTAMPDGTLRAVTRWVAVICLAKGLVIAGLGTLRGIKHVGLGYHGVTSLFLPVCAALLVSGSCATLAERAWGRWLLTIWAGLNVSYLVLRFYSELMVAPLMVHSPKMSPLIYGVLALDGFTDGLLMPLLVIGILFQPEIARLLSRSRGRGFPVVLPAEANSEDSRPTST